MMFALFKEVRKPERRKKRKLNHGGGANPVESEESDESEESEEESTRMPKPNKAKMPMTLQHPQPPEPQHPLAGVSVATRAPTGPLSERLATFKQRLGQLMAGPFASEDAIPIQDLIPAINEGLPSEALFGTAEAVQCAEAMNEANDIMFSDKIVYKL